MFYCFWVRGGERIGSESDTNNCFNFSPIFSFILGVIETSGSSSLLTSSGNSDKDIYRLCRRICELYFMSSLSAGLISLASSSWPPLCIFYLCKTAYEVTKGYRANIWFFFGEISYSSSDTFSIFELVILVYSDEVSSSFLDMSSSDPSITRTTSSDWELLL